MDSASRIFLAFRLGHSSYKVLVNSRWVFLIIATFLLPSVSFAEEMQSATQLDLKHHFIGYLGIAITVLAYAIAMTEDLHQLSKAKPMVLGSALIWLAIFVYYKVEFGSAKNVAIVFQTNLMS